MSEQLITRESATYTEEQRHLIENVLCKGGTPMEIKFFLEFSKRVRLDPFKRQIYAIKRWDAMKNAEVMQFQVGIDGLRAIAARCKTADNQDAYAGSDKPRFTYDNNNNLFSAEVTVYRMVQGVARAFTAEVYWIETVQTKKGGEVTQMWKKRPLGQLGKCAESAALRKAFPEEAGQLYIEEEFDEEEDRPQKVRPVVVTTQPQPTAEGRLEPHHHDGEEVPLDRVSKWSQLLPDRWRGIKVESGPFSGESVNELVNDPDAFDRCLPEKPCLLLHAMHCGYYVKNIEFGILQVKSSVEQMSELLAAGGLFPAGTSILDCPGSQLPEIKKQLGERMREEIKKRKAQAKKAEPKSEPEAQEAEQQSEE